MLLSGAPPPHLPPPATTPLPNSPRAFWCPPATSPPARLPGLPPRLPSRTSCKVFKWGDRYSVAPTLLSGAPLHISPPPPPPHHQPNWTSCKVFKGAQWGKPTLLSTPPHTPRHHPRHHPNRTSCRFSLFVAPTALWCPPPTSLFIGVTSQIGPVVGGNWCTLRSHCSLCAPPSRNGPVLSSRTSCKVFKWGDRYSSLLPHCSWCPPPHFPPPPPPHHQPNRTSCWGELVHSSFTLLSLVPPPAETDQFFLHGPVVRFLSGGTGTLRCSHTALGAPPPHLPPPPPPHHQPNRTSCKVFKGAQWGNRCTLPTLLSGISPPPTTPSPAKSDQLLGF